MEQAKPFPPYLWLRRKERGDNAIFYIVYPGPAPDFKQLNRSTGYKKKQERKANQALAIYVASRERKDLVDGTPEEGPLTVTRLADKWLARKEAKGISTVDNYRSKLRVHILPIIGDMRADEVRIEHIEKVMAAVACKELANKTQRRIYETMHAMFGWAVPRLLETSPCGIKGEDLPEDIYKKPNFQAEAEFTRKEVLAIVTSPLIPIDRRIFYAVMFLSGMRVGEASALLVRHYQRDTEPLGKLLVGHSYNTPKGLVTRTKTKVDRVIPVHPELARLLIWWLEVGWAEMMGRQPAPGDVLIPTRNGGHRDSNTTWKQLNGEPGRVGRVKRNGERGKRGKPNPGDLARLGLPRRRVHDTRHTFVTIMLDDGARPDLLQLITHGPGRKIMAQYTARPPWKALCAEVLKLEIDLSSKSAESVDQEAAKVATEVAMGEIISGVDKFASDPRGIRSRVGSQDSDGQTTTVSTKRRGPAVFTPRAHGASAGKNEHPRSMATLATLALRQALAALDRGRVDQARQVLERAIEEESADAEAAS